MTAGPGLRDQIIQELLATTDDLSARMDVLEEPDGVGTRRRKSAKRYVAEPVEYLGVLWLNTNVYHFTETPYAEATCKDHDVPLLYRSWYGAVREPSKDDFIGEHTEANLRNNNEHGSPFCPLGHHLLFSEETSYGSARTAVEAIMQADIRRQRARDTNTEPEG